MLVKPECFGRFLLDDAEQSWREWRTRFENYMSCVDPIYDVLLDESAKAEGPIRVPKVDPSAHNFEEIEAQRKMD
eukprot:10012974-Alexandrium_andersonii.AAC.1